MPEPKKPISERRTTVSFSLPPLFKDRITALTQMGDRSAFLVSLVEEGLRVRYGAQWEEIADHLIDARKDAA